MLLEFSGRRRNNWMESLKRNLQNWACSLWEKVTTGTICSRTKNHRCSLLSHSHLPSRLPFCPPLGSNIHVTGIPWRGSIPDHCNYEFWKIHNWICNSIQLKFNNMNYAKNEYCHKASHMNILRCPHAYRSYVYTVLQSIKCATALYLLKNTHTLI